MIIDIQNTPIHTDQIGLSAQQLNLVFPFHVIFGSDTTLLQVGPKLQQIYPELLLGKPLAHYFSINRPHIDIDFTQIKAQTQALFFLASCSGHVNLRGQMVYLAYPERILFLGSPWVTEMDHVQQLGLGIDDFAIHDPSGDYIFLLQAQKAALADAKKQTATLTMQQAALQERDATFREIYAVTADPKLDFKQFLHKILVLGKQKFCLDTGTLTHIETDHYAIVAAHLSSGAIASGTVLQPHQTYCSETIKSEKPVCIPIVAGSDWANHPGYLAFCTEAYIGTRVMVNGQIYGTLSFSSLTPRNSAFTPLELDLLTMMAQWLGYKIERDLAAKDRADDDDEAPAERQAKGQFLTAMGAEIQTSVDAILEIAGLMLDTPLTEEQRDFAMTIRHKGDALLTIINDRLESSKLESRALDVAPSPGQVHPVDPGLIANCQLPPDRTVSAPPMTVDSIPQDDNPEVPIEDFVLVKPAVETVLSQSDRTPHRNGVSAHTEVPQVDHRPHPTSVDTNGNGDGAKSVTSISHHPSVSLSTMLETSSPVDPPLENESSLKSNDAVYQPDSTAQVLDISTLNSSISIFGDDLKEALNCLSEIYFSETPKVLKTLKMAREGQDAQGLAVAAHTLKASSASLGATIVAELCKQVESQGRSGNVEQAILLSHGLEPEYHRFKIALEEYAASLP